MDFESMQNNYQFFTLLCESDGNLENEFTLINVHCMSLKCFRSTPTVVRAKTSKTSNMTYIVDNTVILTSLRQTINSTNILNSTLVRLRPVTVRLHTTKYD